MQKIRFIGLFLSLGILTVQAEGFADFMMAPAPGVSQKRQGFQEPAEQIISQPVPSRRQEAQPRQPTGNFQSQMAPEQAFQMRQTAPATTASLRYMGRFHPMSENLNIDPGLISRWSQQKIQTQPKAQQATLPQAKVMQAPQPQQNQMQPSRPNQDHLPPWQRPIR